MGGHRINAVHHALGITRAPAREVDEHRVIVVSEVFPGGDCSAAIGGRLASPGINDLLPPHHSLGQLGWGSHRDYKLQVGKILQDRIHKS